MVKTQGPTRQFVAGRYRLVEVLHQGEGGTDWRGEDVEFGRQVVVRELVLPEGLDARTRRRMVARMLREAELMALVCPGRVVTVIDIAEEDDRLWQVAELIEGRPLNEILAQQGPFDPVRATRIGLELLDVLGAAHREGIIHGDVNPSQVLIRSDGSIVLTGFGVTTAATSMPVTAPSYASPERARGEGPGTASDLWSLGAVLYAMVEGRSPYRDRGKPETTLAVVARDPVPPARRAGPLLLAINGLLRKNPQERADEPVVRRVLERILNEAAAEAAAEEGARSWATAGAGRSGRSGRPARSARSGPFGRLGPFGRFGRSSGPAESAAPMESARFAESAAPVASVGPSEPDGHDWRPRPLTVVLVALMVLMATVVGVFVVNGRLFGGGSNAASPAPPPAPGNPLPSLPGQGGDRVPTAAPSRAPSGSPSAPPTAASPSGPPSASAPDGPVALPPGFTQTQDPYGFSIALPDGWSRTGNNGFSSGSRFGAQGDPRNLLVDFTSDPGADPVVAWRKLERSVRENATGYGRVGEIRALEYRGWKAADWEWTFDFRGIRYRTLDRGFVVDGRHGYAIKWTVPAADWESAANQEALDVFLTSFQPAADAG